MKRLFVFVLLAPLLLMLTGCPKEDNPVAPGGSTITTGKSEDIVTVPVGPGGMTLNVDKPGNQLDGMTIEIPAGSYSTTRDFKVTAAPITEHELGAYFHPISPLITIKNGGGYADEVMTLTVPISLPAGHFAMAFLYNEKTGKLEGLPVLKLSSTSITLATRHFATSTVSGPVPALGGGLGNVQDLASIGSIVISSIDEKILLGQSIISTGYTAGTDDWEFINFGSYLAPGGHCAGQSITSMYYFYEKKQREGGPLFHKYDKVQQSREVLWQDNRYGFRYASVLQEDLRWDGWLFNKLLKVELEPAYHHLSWKAFALSMLLTGDPQFVGLSSAGGGHAIVAYKMDLPAGKLYVADPNFPGQERVIEYVNNQFKPYSTRQNANEPDDKPYYGVGYYAKTSMIDWDKIGARWEEFKNKTIGTKGTNRFPTYTLWVNDGAGYELGDTLNTDLDSLPITVKWGGVTDDIAFQVFDVTGTRLVPTASESYSLVQSGGLKLQAGTTTLGVGVYGKKNGKWYWIDFRWITVNLAGFSIEPMSQDGAPISKNGETGIVYGFRVNSNGLAPKNAKYVWHFGDVSGEIVRYNDSTVTHTFAYPGSYTVAVDVYDNSTSKLVGGAVATAKLNAGGIWDILYAQKRVTVQLQATHTYSNGSTDEDSWEVNNIGLTPEPPAITWNGTSFTVEYMEYMPVGELGADTVQCRIEGKLSADGMTIETMTAYRRHIEYVYSLANKLLWVDEEVISFDVANLQGSVSLPTYPPYFMEMGEDVKDLVGNLRHDKRHVYYDPDKPEPDITESHYVSTSWTAGSPILVVGFQL